MKTEIIEKAKIIEKDLREKKVLDVEELVLSSCHYNMATENVIDNSRNKIKIINYVENKNKNRATIEIDALSNELCSNPFRVGVNDDGIYVSIPGRNVYGQEKVNKFKIKKMLNNADSLSDFRRELNKTIKFENSQEKSDIRVFNNIRFNLENRNASGALSVVEEIGAIAGCIFKIKRYGFNGYAKNLMRQGYEKRRPDEKYKQSWRCSSCRYSEKRTISTENEKGMTKSKNIFVCSLSDAKLGDSYKDLFDGLFEGIIVSYGSKEKEKKTVVSCPYHDKNFKIDNIGWISEKPKAFMPLTRQGNELFFLLDGLKVDVTDVLKKEFEKFIENYVGSDNDGNDGLENTTDKEDKDKDEYEKASDSHIKNNDNIDKVNENTNDKYDDKYNTNTKNIDKSKLSEEELEIFKSPASLNIDLPEKQLSLKNMLEDVLIKAKDIGKYRASVIAVQIAEVMPETAEELIETIKKAGDVGPKRFIYIKSALEQEGILNLA